MFSVTKKAPRTKKWPRPKIDMFINFVEGCIQTFAGNQMGGPLITSAFNAAVASQKAKTKAEKAQKVDQVANFATNFLAKASKVR